MGSTRWESLFDHVWRSRLWSVGAEWSADFLSLIYPTSCVVCEAWDVSLCQPCGEQVCRATIQPRHAEDWAESLPVHSLRGSPLPVLAAGIYAGALARTVLAYKNHGHTDVGRVLATALARSLHIARHQAFGQDHPELLIVPVPTRAGSLRRRGYDPVRMLVTGLQSRGELPDGCSVSPAVVQLGVLTAGNPEELRRALTGVRAAARRRTRSQKGLGSRGRRANVAGSMTVADRFAGRLEGRHCLVVDDVLTTGSTIAEVDRVLRSERAVVVGAVVLAATPPPGLTSCSLGK